MIYFCSIGLFRNRTSIGQFWTFVRPTNKNMPSRYTLREIPAPKSSKPQLTTHSGGNPPYPDRTLPDPTRLWRLLCQECGRYFSRKSYLSTHIRTVHRGERPWKCRHCGKSFGQSSNRDTHERAACRSRLYDR